MYLLLKMVDFNWHVSSPEGYTGTPFCPRKKGQILQLPTQSLAVSYMEYEPGVIIPRHSMYGIFTYIWLIFMVNVGKYTIH